MSEQEIPADVLEKVQEELGNMQEEVAAEPEAPKYTVENIEVDGVKGKIVKTDDGRELFTVPDGFADYQIEVVYNLCNDYFGKGINAGIQKMQADLQNVLGLPQLTARLILTREQELAVEEAKSDTDEEQAE